MCAVTDGAEWERGFIDSYREDAIRTLDFCHAAGYVSRAGQAVLGEGTPLFQAWLKNTLHESAGNPDRHGENRQRANDDGDTHLVNELTDTCHLITISPQAAVASSRQSSLVTRSDWQSPIPIS